MTLAEEFAAQGAQWQATGRFDMATQLYAASLQHDPSNLPLRWHLAECLAYLQQLDEAAEHYLLVAQGYVAMGREAECLAVCDRVIQLAPHAFVDTTVGPMMRRIGRAARPVCARAAEAHLRAGRQAEGLYMLRLGSELDADSPEARLQLARIYKSRSMIVEAVEAMADAGDLLRAAERTADYVKVAELLLELDPDHIDTLRELPRAYLVLQRPHDATRLLSQLTRVSPGDIVGYEVLAQTFALIGHTDKSLTVLERLVDELGALGRGNRADAILERAKAWRPSDLGFLRALRRLEVPKPAAARPPAREAHEVPPEGTVSLDIRDLMMGTNSTAAVAPEEVVLRSDDEGTLTLELGPRLRRIAETTIEPLPDDATRSEAAPAPLPPLAAPRVERTTTESAQAQPQWPEPEDLDASMSLDVSALVQALATDAPWEALRALVTDEDDEDANEDAATVPPASAIEAPPDEDDDEATALAMTKLSDRDIARAQARSRPRPPSAPVRVAPPPPPPLPPTAPRASGGADDAPTIDHVPVLTASDIARAVARSSAPKRRPIEDEVTNARPSAPEVHAGDDEDAMTLAKMEVLTAEDIARALRRKIDPSRR